MKQRFLLFTLVLGFVFAFYSCKKEGQSKYGLLWEVSGNGLSSPSYLFATANDIHKSFLDSVPGFNESFDKCKQFVNEVDMSTLEDYYNETIFPDKMPDSLKYASLLSVEDLDSLNQVLNVYTRKKADEMGLRPATYASMLFMLRWPKYQPIGYLSDEVLEVYLENQARKKNYSLIPLETAADQKEMLHNQIPIQIQAKRLAVEAKSRINQDASIAVYEAYRKQDIEEIAKIKEQTTERWNSLGADYAISDVDRKLVSDRHGKWLGKIVETIKSAPAFIAVRATDMVGDNGLIELLRKQGYTVQPVIKL